MAKWALLQSSAGCLISDLHNKPDDINHITTGQWVCRTRQVQPDFVSQSSQHTPVGFFMILLPLSQDRIEGIPVHVQFKRIAEFVYQEYHVYIYVGAGSTGMFYTYIGAAGHIDSTIYLCFLKAWKAFMFGKFLLLSVSSWNGTPKHLLVSKE